MLVTLEVVFQSKIKLYLVIINNHMFHFRWSFVLKLFIFVSVTVAQICTWNFLKIPCFFIENLVFGWKIKFSNELPNGLLLILNTMMIKLIPANFRPNRWFISECGLFSWIYLILFLLIVAYRKYRNQRQKPITLRHRTLSEGDPA